jgi:hypothetical protein
MNGHLRSTAPVATLKLSYLFQSQQSTWVFSKLVALMQKASNKTPRKDEQVLSQCRAETSCPIHRTCHRHQHCRMDVRAVRTENPKSVEPNDSIIIAAADSDLIYRSSVSGNSRHGRSNCRCWVKYTNATIPAAAVPVTWMSNQKLVEGSKN